MHYLILDISLLCGGDFGCSVKLSTVARPHVAVTDKDEGFVL